jgi:hypothetical protein
VLSVGNKVSPDLSEPWGLKLRQKGMSDNVVESIKKMYNDTKFRVKRGGGEVADSVEQRNGIRQACILSPYLCV